MRCWNFPPALIESIGSQNDPAEAQQYVLETAIVHIAVCLKNLEIPADDVPLELDFVDPVAWQRSGLVPADMASVMRAAVPLPSSALATLFPQFSRLA